MQGKYGVMIYFIKFQYQWKVWHWIFSIYFSMSGIWKYFFGFSFVTLTRIPHWKKDHELTKKHVLHSFQPLEALVTFKFKLCITDVYFRNSEKFVNFRQKFDNKNITFNVMLC
jgi:hypothetical protein